MTVEISQHSGAVLISDIIDNQLVTRQYYFYSKEEAIEEFENEFNTNEKEN